MKCSVNKCSEVEWSVVGWSVTKFSEDLSNRASAIIRRYVDEVCCLYGFFIYHIHVPLVSIFIIVYMVYILYASL